MKLARNAWKWLLFLMFLAAMSRFLTLKQGPAIINGAAMTVGGLFQNTLNG